MIYDVGDKVTLTTIVRTDAGVPVNTPTVTVAVTRPDGTPVSPAPTVTNTGVGGVYTATVTADVAGLWTCLWTAAGSVVGTDPDQFTVATFGGTTVCSMQELKAQLNIDADDTTNDLELRSYLVSTTEVVEHHVGPIGVSTFTEKHRVVSELVAPRRRPLIGVVSITPRGGTALAATAYEVDTDTASIELLVCWWGVLTLVYQAGWAGRLPERNKLAGMMIAQHLWNTQHGSGGRTFPGGDEATVIVPGFSFAIPARALELMRPDILGGFA